VSSGLMERIEGTWNSVKCQSSERTEPNQSQ